MRSTKRTSRSGGRECQFRLSNKSYIARPWARRAHVRSDRDYGRLYNARMDEKLFAQLPAWLTQAGLDGTPEAEIVCGFCERCVAAGIRLGRVHVFIDTLD